MIQAFLSKYALAIGGGILVVIVLMYALGQIKESGRSAERADTLQATIATTNTHVQIEEKQIEIHNRTITDAELFDSLRHGSL